MQNLISNSPVLLSTVSTNAAFSQTLNTAFISLIVILILLAAIAIFLEWMRLRSPRAAQRKQLRMLTIPVYFVAVLVLALTLLCNHRLNQADPQLSNPSTPSQPTQSSDPTQPSDPSVPTIPSDPSDPTQPSDPPAPTIPSFTTKPHYTANTDPKNWEINWEIIVDGAVVESYQRPTQIQFGDPDTYFGLPGVPGFRGSNYRDDAVYGTAEVTQKALTEAWKKEISFLPKPASGNWTGAGWTGQPLVVQWDEETKSIMNLYPAAKAKQDLVEVIYATLDGNIYFYDLQTGEYTRDPMYLGMAFKGAGALDPRGYPIMYVGSGDITREGKTPRMFIINLIDCTVMFEQGHQETWNYRDWIAFDSSPLVDAETDTLIWPGESGILYTYKLNTTYDKANGTLTINPDAPVMARYTTNTGRTLGFENSAVLVENYLYVGDNGGMLLCIDINTMELVWAQNIRDDLNATAVFEWGENGDGYLYLATSMEFAEGKSYIYKLSAVTGEIIWEKCYDDVGFDKNVSGGALSSPLLGRKGTTLEGMILFHIARTPTFGSGTLVALDTATGEVKWDTTTNHYSWSSPVAVYTEDGQAYVIQCDSGGWVHLLDGATGSEYCKIGVGGNVEASPVVFNDMLVVGTRGQKVFGIKIS